MDGLAGSVHTQPAIEMLLHAFLALSLLELGSCVNFVVVAPNVMRWEKQEKVYVTLEGDATANVKLYVKEWPTKTTTLSTQTQNQVGDGNVVEFHLKVRAEDFPWENDRLELGDRKIVILYAEVGGVTKESRILMTNNIANVFVQTDKPLYTPGQQVFVSVFTTDMDNLPTKMPIRLDVLSPGGLVVQRVETESEHTSDTTNTKLEGVFRHTITLHRRPQYGNWSIVVSYGPTINGEVQYVQSTSATIEIKEYVLPSFSCKVKNIANFIFEGSTDTFDGIVSARYTHGKPVVGYASIRFGIMDGETTLSIVRVNGQFVNGYVAFHLDISKLYAYSKPKDTAFNFTQHVNGKRLVIDAVCTEQSTGDHMVDINSQAIFVSTPFKFNFERTITHFKPGLPVVVQFQLLYKNGIYAQDVRVEVYGIGIKSNGLRVNLNLQQEPIADLVLTAQHGRGRVIYGSRLDIDRIEIKFKVPTNEGHVDHEDILTLKKSQSPSDIVIKLNGASPLQVFESASIEIHMRGVITEFTWLVLSRGSIVEAKKNVGEWSGLEHLRIPITREMVPSIRIVIFFIKNNIVAGDSLWIDVEDKCDTPMLINTDKENYQYNGEDKTIQVNVEWSPNAFVVMQMVDHAVLVLNDRTSLTPRRMWQQLDSLDMGCGGGSGSNTSAMFARSGLAVSTSLTDASGELLNTGLRLLDTCEEDIDYTSARKRRDLDERVLEEEDCCLLGTQEDAEQLDTRCEDLMADMVYANPHYSIACLDMVKVCCRNTSRPPPEREDGGERSAFTDEEIYDIRVQIQESGPRVNFPESVFIGIAELSDSGQGFMKFGMPDSITTWAVEAVGMDSSFGMCVAQPYDFTVSKDLHMKVRLPFRAVRGEHLNARVTFYNFQENFSQIDLYMKGVEGICSKAKPSRFTAKRTLEINAGESKSVTWPIVPMQVGQHKLRFVAMIGKNHVVDVVDRTLTVVTEGILKTKEVSFVVDPNSQNIPKTDGLTCQADGGVVKCDVSIIMPDTRVEDSVHGRIRITGNTFGAAVDIIVNGLDVHLRMPRGCGEQIMIRMAPGVYAFHYMQQTSQISTKLEKTLSSYVTEAMTMLLPMRKGDGFSVWPKPKYPAKVWLTSQILKVFSKAEQMVGNVDHNVLDEAVTFLYSKQTTTGDDKGRFKENTGRLVHHLEMVGAVTDKDLTLTAYVVIALMESKRNNQAQEAEIGRSFDYLARKVHQTQSTYEKALVAYALSFTNRPESIVAFNRLKLDAIEEIYQDSRWRYFPAAQQRLKVETASYAILTALRHGEVDYCYDIMIWLHRQRTSSGKIFHTTQDTIIALQALAEYSIATKNRRTELYVVLHNLKDDDEDVEITITDQDKNREYVYELDETVFLGRNEPVRFSVSGDGTAQLTVEALYNVDDEPARGFDVEVTPTFPPRDDADDEEDDEEDDAEEKKLMSITVRARYVGDGEQTGMAMIEVGLLTGYEAEIESLDTLVTDKIIDEYEVSDVMVSMYLPYLQHDVVTTVTFSATQEEIVSQLSPAVVKVYDYYNRDTETITFYPETQDYIPEYHAETRECYEGRCGKCYGPGETKRLDIDQFKQKACHSADITFVFRVRYLSTEETKEWTKTHLQIERVYKQGLLHVQPPDQIVLRQRLSCRCPQLEAHHFNGNDRFFLYGKDEATVNDADGNPILQFTANSDTYVEVWKSKQLREFTQFLAKPCVT